MVTSAERSFRNPIGKEVVVRAELRVPEGRSFLRYAVGRVDDKSPIGLSRQGFFEDIPHAIESLIELYVSGIDQYIRFETDRIRRNVGRDLDTIETVVSGDVDGWKADLRKIRQEMVAKLPNV